jgi:hypothetical protein
MTTVAAPELNERDRRRFDRAVTLYAWKDYSYLDRQSPIRRKIKRAERLFAQLGIAR